MGLKAVFLDFSGSIIDDEAINQSLLADILLGENLRANDTDYAEYCRGRSDRACLNNILVNRGRVLADDYLNKLVETKTKAYLAQIEQLTALPISPDLEEFLLQLKEQDIAIGLVTGASRSVVEYVLQEAKIREKFDLIITGDETTISKPEPDPYLLAIKNLSLQPCECLAIEDNLIGIESAKRAKIQVVGIANIYPLHMLQRIADWTVDHFLEIELERIDRVLSQA